MSTVVDINSVEREYTDGMDPVVIRRYMAGITGGRTLDMTSFGADRIRAGHIVVRETETDTYRPLPVKDNNYEALPDGCEYVGVVVASKPKNAPFVAIMNMGEVNDVASPYPITDEIRKAFKEVLPCITFAHD